ncbi:MAG: hypothetical protein ACR2M9_04935 [Cyanophyceae cyanobacterium]
MTEDWIRDYYGYNRLWNSIFNGAIPQHQVKNNDMGATLRHLIEQLEQMAEEIEKKEDFEADITLRFNDKIYTIEIKQVASLEDDSENDTDITDDNSSNGA